MAVHRERPRDDLHLRRPEGVRQHVAAQCGRDAGCYYAAAAAATAAASSAAAATTATAATAAAAAAATTATAATRAPDNGRRIRHAVACSGIRWHLPPD